MEALEWDTAEAASWLHVEAQEQPFEVLGPPKRLRNVAGMANLKRFQGGK